MGPKRRGDGASRVRGSDVDAGLHTETDAGPIDVGLALSDTAAGVVVDAPGLGLLRVAFETANDGSIRLTALSRKSNAAELYEAPTLVVDKARVDQLEAQVASLEVELEAALAEARGLNGKLANGEARLATLEEALEGATAQRARALEKVTSAAARVERIEAKLEAAKAVHAESLAAHEAALQALREEQASATSSREQAHEAALAALREKLSASASSQEEAHEAALTALREQHEAEVLELREKVSTTTLQRDDALGEVRALDEKLTALEATAKALREELTAAAAARDEAQARP
jgi:chemotaxis protein MotB